MSDNTKIEWADATVNAVNGCSVVSPGCTNCYAMRLAGTRLKHHPSRTGLTTDTKAGPVWTGEVRLNQAQLLAPLKWRRPRRIFWNAHGDLFHENVPDDWIDQVFAVAALTPQHQHLILTKRSVRMREYVTDRDTPRNVWDVASESDRILQSLAAHGAMWGGDAPWPLRNVWLGVSAEDQKRADERIPDLLATPAAVRFLSAEPLLAGLDIRQYLPGEPFEALLSNFIDARGVRRADMTGHPLEGLDWVIAGGESGPNARGSTAEVEANMRSLRDQCAAAGVAFFGKQNFGKRPLPADLMVREFPA